MRNDNSSVHQFISSSIHQKDNNMKYFLYLFLLVSSATAALAQDPFWDTDFPTFPTSTYEDQNNTAFGMLDQTNYPSNRIYDRTDYISKILVMDGNNTTDIINYDDWLTMYAEMQLSKQDAIAEVPTIDEDAAEVLETRQKLVRKHGRCHYRR